MPTFRLFLIISLLAYAIGAGFGPWVYRAPVALQLTPPSLAEYVKFLHETLFGILNIERLYFLLPLVVAAFSTSLIAVNERLHLHWGFRGLLRLSVVPMALSLLSPIWAPDRLMNDEFRLQTMVALGAIGVALIAFLFKKLPLILLLLIVALAAVGGLWFALEQFFLAQPAIAATYNSPVALGWGGWLTVAGGTGLVFSAISVWFVKR